MPFTQNDLVIRTLQKLNVIGAGEGAPAEDGALVRAALPAKLAELERRGVYRVDNVEEIDDEAFLALASIMARELSTDFGASGEILAGIMRDALEGEQTLREIAPRDDAGETVQMAYF